MLLDGKDLWQLGRSDSFVTRKYAARAFDLEPTQDLLCGKCYPAEHLEMTQKERIQRLETMILGLVAIRTEVLDTELGVAINDVLSGGAKQIREERA